MGSFWSDVENFLIETEQDVISLIADLRKGATIAEADVAKAMKWIAQSAPSIATDIQQVLTIATEFGVGANPEVAAAIGAANDAVAALNAYATAYNSGTGTAQAVVAGYSAVKSAQAAAASAAASTVKAAAPAT